LQDPPKFTQIWIFWFENIPSGNPETDTKTCIQTNEVCGRAAFCIYQGCQIFLGPNKPKWEKYTK
jgi:hypothetical protein